LISRDERTFELPHSSKKGGGGYGQSNIWYANNLNDKPIRKRVLEYIDSIIKRKISDEPKYHLYDENKITITTTTQITRNQKAREECIKIKGCRCNICGFDFKEKYGGLGENYIEVHHITPIGSLSTSVEYEGTNPEKDLIPLCSNCHSMIHRKNPPYSPTEIKKRVVNAPN
jgi:5-methylcytosine-specific restriction protein A